MLMRQHEEYLTAVGIDKDAKTHRRRALREVLDVLDAVDGDSWQMRWLASNTETASGRRPAGVDRGQEARARLGMRFLLAYRHVQPGYDWLLDGRMLGLADELRHSTDAEDLTRVHERATATHIPPRTARDALDLVARLLIHTGRRMDELTTQDLLDYQAACRRKQREAHGLQTAYQLLRGLRVPGIVDTPSLNIGRRRRIGQLSIDELVDHHSVGCQPVRDLLVRYLRERAPSLDYSSLCSLTSHLVRLFWTDLERHHPGIDSLRLTPQLAQQWKERARRCTDGRPRQDWMGVFMAVRSFYLDIAHWAVTDPAAWAPWVAPSPVSASDLKGMTKLRRQRQARIHSRIRAAAPVLPALVRATEQRLRHAEALLAAMRETDIDGVADIDGRRYQRLRLSEIGRPRQANGYHGVFALAVGDDPTNRINVLREEEDAFWAWSTVEVLRLTGIRCEELLELTHLSIRQYRQPDGQLTLLLQIAPSKTDQERVIPVVPELAHALARIVARVKDDTGKIPLLERYDPHQRQLSPPLPHLFQRRRSGGFMMFSAVGLREVLNRAVDRAGLRDIDGSPLHLSPHDYRRIFATDAVSGGLPIHIAAKVLGHIDLNTTQGYTAIYPQDVIQHMQAHLARRRAGRPSEEYRDPSSAEWAKFEQHFGKRTMELGHCRRPYSTPCIHEHACLRCPMLEIPPEMKPRLVDIQINARSRLQTAQDQGWFGEVEALELNLVHIHDKLGQLERSQARQGNIANELLTPTDHTP
jgi:integrase